ncbi:MAG: DUF4276 family protein [Bacteroidales bacterium]|nr:DUF4276 family protein [Bacteroidales bacterium]
MYESKVILNVLCEGKTEEEFIKHVLKPYLQPFNIIAKSILLTTSRKKNAQGGLNSYTQVQKDLRLLIAQTSHKANELHYFTTMFDFYKLPNDFPLYKRASSIHDVYKKIETLETAFLDDIQHPHFIPYIQLHEFEAFLFCGIEQLAQKYNECAKDIRKLEDAVRECKGNPEMVNGGISTAPSKRITNIIDKTYHYNKPQTGREITKQIGITKLKERCLHFSEWIEKLEHLVRN